MKELSPAVLSELVVTGRFFAEMMPEVTVPCAKRGTNGNYRVSYLDLIAIAED
jgi:hypothetical protein